MQTLDFIDSSRIKSFSISVTEKIDSRYLLTFLRTHIENQNFLLGGTSYFYYYFHPKALQYEVILFDRLTLLSLPKIFILKAYPKMQKITLFLLKDSFCLFIDTEPALFKKVDKIIEEDIISYIEQVYDIKVDKVVDIIDEEVDTLIPQFQKERHNKIEKKIFPLQEEKCFRYFQYFLLTASFVFVFLFYALYQEKQESNKYLNSEQTTQALEVQKRLINRYKQFQKQSFIKRLTPLFQTLNSLDIKVFKFEYNDGKFWMQLLHSKKELLFQLLEQKEWKFKTKAIYFEKSLQSHILEVEIVL
jgi:hypothetical protein